MLKEDDLFRANIFDSRDFEMLRSNGLELQYVKQTFDLCIVAVKQNGLALEFVNNQTEEICIAAVINNGFALEFVKHQTEDICLVAVKQNGLAYKYINIKQFPDVYVYYKLLWS